MIIKLIIGLGNPGPKYEHTRHNIGFCVVDALAKKFSGSFIEEIKFKCLTAAFDFEQTRIILAKPQTFMNESGQAVSRLKKFFKIANSEILVVHDEVDLPLKKIRLSFDISSAGHNGVQSIIDHIGQNFHRLRVGTDSRSSRLEVDTYDYVLQNFTAEEEELLHKKIIPAAVAEIEKKFLRRS